MSDRSCDCIRRADGSCCRLSLNLRWVVVCFLWAVFSILTFSIHIFMQKILIFSYLLKDLYIRFTYNIPNFFYISRLDVKLVIDIDMAQFRAIRDERVKYVYIFNNFLRSLLMIDKQHFSISLAENSICFSKINHSCDGWNQQTKTQTKRRIDSSNEKTHDTFDFTIINLK